MNTKTQEVANLVDLNNVREPNRLHQYPRRPRMHDDGSWRDPAPGDVAICGHVKIRPSGGRLAGLPRCYGCFR